MSYKIKRDKADNVFSQYVRLRDMECRRCHSPVVINAKGLPVSHQASHFMGRRKENTRFNEFNVDTLCGGCHSLFTANPALHYEWQVQVKGKEMVDNLILWSGMYKKKDREMDFIYWSQRLKELL
jgi:5-methylcytosine-specific restriction endonuclease McrA